MNGIGQRKTLAQTGTAFSSARSVAWNYDGNGNVTQYLTSTGASATSFECDPFGRLMINNFTNLYLPYRFSTKPLDQPTGFYYYGYRYYDPNTGRWPSRDPIEENGGINLYGFVGNDGVGRIDVLGEFFSVAVMGVITAAVAVVVSVIVYLDGEIDDNNCKQEIQQFEENCREITKSERKSCLRRRGGPWVFHATTNSRTCGNRSSTVDCGGNCVCY